LGVVGLGVVALCVVALNVVADVVFVVVVTVVVVVGGHATACGLPLLADAKGVTTVVLERPSRTPHGMQGSYAVSPWKDSVARLGRFAKMPFGSHLMGLFAIVRDVRLVTWLNTSKSMVVRLLLVRSMVVSAGRPSKASSSIRVIWLLWRSKVWTFVRPLNQSDPILVNSAPRRFKLVKVLDTSSKAPSSMTTPAFSVRYRVCTAVRPLNVSSTSVRLGMSVRHSFFTQETELNVPGLTEVTPFAPPACQAITLRAGKSLQRSVSMWSR
jgi:hypothetical protein